MGILGKWGHSGEAAADNVILAKKSLKDMEISKEERAKREQDDIDEDLPERQNVRQRGILQFSWQCGHILGSEKVWAAVTKREEN